MTWKRELLMDHNRIHTPVWLWYEDAVELSEGEAFPFPEGRSIDEVHEEYGFRCEKCIFLGYYGNSMQRAILPPRWVYRLAPPDGLFAEPVLKIFVEAGRSYRWCRRCGFREWVELPPHPFIEDYQDEKLR
jgi:hypothetical protein